MLQKLFFNNTFTLTIRFFPGNGDVKKIHLLLFESTSHIFIFFSLWVKFCRALHEKEIRVKGGLTRNQFFLIAFTCSFAYYVLPGYLFPTLTSLSWLCWLFPASVLAQQLGSGLHGLGIGAVGLDWSSISSYLGSPLASPWFATANIAVGYFLIMYIITPITYWLNVYKARTFPIFSDDLFTSTGQKYNISAIVDSNFHIDMNAYEHEGRLYLSTFFAMTYAFSFACLTATIVHVFLFHGRLVVMTTRYLFLYLVTFYSPKMLIQLV